MHPRSDFSTTPSRLVKEEKIEHRVCFVTIIRGGCLRWQRSRALLPSPSANANDAAASAVIGRVLTARPRARFSPQIFVIRGMVNERFCPASRQTPVLHRCPLLSDILERRRAAQAKLFAWPRCPPFFGQIGNNSEIQM